MPINWTAVSASERYLNEVRMILPKLGLGGLRLRWDCVLKVNILTTVMMFSTTPAQV